MAALSVAGVRVAGIACAVPTRLEGIEVDAELYGQDAARKICEATGVNSRYVVEAGVCTSDLCHAAAEQVLDDLGWSRESIQALVFVSQTPDYLLPATSCCLQKRLGLSPQCAAFDINLGCSGYVYGLLIAGQLVANGLSRVLLLVGDTVSRISARTDRSTRPLFGDAGSATALDADRQAIPWQFNLGTDGGGEEHLIVRAGLFRQAFGDCSKGDRPGNHLFMDGPEIFAFALREVPPLTRATLAAAGWSMDTVDAFVMHQANLFLLRHLAKRLSLPVEKQPISLDRFGNTSSASIPLTIADSLANRCEHEALRVVLVGFGVGYSWGAAAITLGPIQRPQIVTVASPGAAGITEESTHVKPA